MSLSNGTHNGLPHATGGSPASLRGLPLVDRHGRVADYARISVTDRCNLRCSYCRCEGDAFIPHEDILRYEELLAVTDVLVAHGVRKVRLTGGEPFVRKGFTGFVQRLVTAHPALDVRITTNGTLTAPHLPALVAMGVRRINISLDTLDRQRFERITGRDELDAVRTSIDTALELGMEVKLNAVAMLGVNEADMPAFVELARNNPLTVRFIEFMPMGKETAWENARFWPAPEILQAAREHAELVPVIGAHAHAGPAEVYDIVGGQGAIGVISPLTNHFCGRCNRIRITPTGNIRTCLYSDTEYRLRPLLRHPGIRRETLERTILGAIAGKPIGAHILKAKQSNAVALTRMNAIGG